MIKELNFFELMYIIFYVLMHKKIIIYLFRNSNNVVVFIAGAQ